MKISLDQGQELRKQGMYLITDKEITKVLGVVDNRKDALKMSKNGKMWEPLSKMHWTKEDTQIALEELSAGLQCNF